MCVLLCYPVSFHMLQLLSTGRPLSSVCVQAIGHSFFQIYFIFTSAKEVMFLPGFDCRFVSLFLNHITQNLWMDFDEIFSICLKRKKMIQFWE